MAQSPRWRIKPDPEHPGRYISPLESCPGYIQFPYPFMLRHFKTWWEAGVAPLKNQSPLDYSTFEAEWQGAKGLLLEYGEVSLANVVIGDIREDSLPMEVVAWMCDVTDHYVSPHLSLRKQRLLSIAT